MEEEKYLEKVQNIIKENIDDLTKKANDEKEMIISNKRYLFEHKNEIMDTDLTEMMNKEDLNVDLTNQMIKKVNTLMQAGLNPYFGRVDFNKEKIYIGITDISKNFKNYVYDWRSDIASIYYDEKIGKNIYKIGEENIEGEVTLRRGYNIKMGKLINYFDSDIALRDKMLQEVLNKNASKEMQNIVTSIQKEQNEIIRYNGNIVVEGTSGSGKTSIAMHRIAYELYKSKVSNKNILIFTPSIEFTKFISGVLPSLNEGNVRMITFKKFINNYLDGKAESLNDYYEKSFTDVRGKEKLSIKYKEKIEKYLKNYKKNLKFTNSIALNKTIISKETLNKYLEKDMKIYNLIDYICDKVCDSFDISYDKNYEKLNKKIRKLLNMKETPLDIYNEFLTSIGENIISYFSYPDVAAALYLYFEIEGYPRLGYIKEVVIDEAQDFNIFELELIKKIFNGSKFTILGDVNQNINKLFKYKSLEDLTNLFDAKYIYLNKAYRSSKKIVEYSNKILGLEGIKAVRTYNVDVTEKENASKKDIDLLIKKYKEKGFVPAIITKTKKEKDYLKQFNFDAKIYPVNIAKGLEFDAVIVINTFTDEEKNLFYVATTRAMHELSVIKKINF